MTNYVYALRHVSCVLPQTLCGPVCGPVNGYNVYIKGHRLHSTAANISHSSDPQATIIDRTETHLDQETTTDKQLPS